MSNISKNSKSDKPIGAFDSGVGGLSVLKEIKKILHPLVTEWFFSKFPEFSLPQKYGVLAIWKRKNILISAETGGTKTLTAFLSILNYLIILAEKQELKNKVYAVYTSPLKALSSDIWKNLIEPLHDSHFRERGHCMSADVAAITLANIESLTGRMKEHCKNANYIAKFLSNHPKVNQVFYPTFGKRAGINKKLMPKGFGGLLSFEVKGGLEAARIVLENLELFWHAPNIGESRSLILCPWVTTHGVMNDEEKLKAGITPGTLRLSMGREDPRDPKIDLNKGLKLI